MTSAEAIGHHLGLTLSIGAVLLAVAFAVSLWLAQRNGKRARDLAYVRNRSRLSNVPIDLARQAAMAATSNWPRKLNEAGAIETASSFSNVIGEFVSTFAELARPNGALRLGSNFVAASNYRQGMTVVGKSDYLEICVRPGSETVYVIDGSEGEEVGDTYPSIFHLLMDYADAAC
ncbi:hypothetical protein [Ramlibacter albus]|uniref:Uncharacterized protein n=1 Tax=Ramlibacter albus TaxID=2079448 RepID=A0A923S2S3_9BURK|nr:hypothetical protein [Ramlibacter albus]MBC5765651.1 hypothetical protein [Ramlibacter albus]